jgi:hypothetical protein
MAELAGAEVTAGAEALVVKEIRKEDADDTENGEKNVQEVLAGKIAQLDAKKNEDKSTEKELSRMYKKASKELKEQLDAITSDSEKVKFLQQKFLDKMHQCNAADRKVENMQVRRWCRGAGTPGPHGLVLVLHPRTHCSWRGVAGLLAHACHRALAEVVFTPCESPRLRDGE